MHKFVPLDHSAHLADILAQLYRLEDLVLAGDREALLELVADMDWHAVTDEFELVVASHYYALEHFARRIAYNLQRPYLLLQDCLSLEHHLASLERAIEESPSLLDGADASVEKSWQRELEKAGQRHRPVREMAPVASLADLRTAATRKIRLGRALAGRHGQFDAGERVPYENLDAGPRAG